MALVDEVFDKILGKEGGYVNNPADRGGETNWGITIATARRNGYTGRMIDMTREQAIEIYKADYWFAPKFDKLAEISEVIACKLADIGVNMGPKVGVGFFQRWLNGFNQNGKIYSDQDPDGLLGKNSFDALRAFLKHRGEKGEQVLLKAINCSQGAHYLDITVNRPANEAFLYGWIANRID